MFAAHRSSAVQLTAHANAYAERFVRSIKEECLNRLIPFGERHHRRAVAEFVAYYHREQESSRAGQRTDRGPVCETVCQSSSSTPTSRWAAELLRASSVNDVASG